MWWALQLLHPLVGVSFDFLHGEELTIVVVRVREGLSLNQPFE
jgi:hypothetical protein